MNAECRVCGKTFKRLHPTNTCCSEKCRNALLRMRKCCVCGARFKRLRPTQKCCSEECSNALRRTYLRTYAADRSRAHGTKLVAEHVLGRALTPDEVVHHEDGDKTNNRPDNLVVFPTQAAHAAHHQLGHPGNGPCDCAGAIRLEGRDA